MGSDNSTETLGQTLIPIINKLQDLFSKVWTLSIEFSRPAVHVPSVDITPKVFGLFSLSDSSCTSKLPSQ